MNSRSAASRVALLFNDHSVILGRLCYVDTRGSDYIMVPPVRISKTTVVGLLFTVDRG